MADPKSLSTLRILEILKKRTNFDHRLTQNEIGEILHAEYGIEMERKAIGRKIQDLKEAGYWVESTENGAYLDGNVEFEDEELRLLIDSVLASQHISATKSKELIEKLANQSNNFFKSHIKHVYAVKEFNKTDSNALFYNISAVDQAITEKKRVQYTYNKYDATKKLKKSSTQVVTPYQMVLHNQHYYLIAYSEYWGNMVFHRMDKISNLNVTEEKGTDLRTIPGYENGLDYKKISNAMPYMYTDAPVPIVFVADSAALIDQIIDWFGKDITLIPGEKEQIEVHMEASPAAFEFWALQYLNHVEVISPQSLRDTITKDLKEALKKYQKK